MTKRNYDNWSKEELISEVEKLEKKLKKNYGLVWKDKIEEVASLCKEKLPILEEDPKKEIKADERNPVNILIEGDNYHALSVLNYTHKGKIDVIYIDPPYNTGNEGFIYNDKIVDAEDSFRHSKWLSFLEKRLVLAKNLLSNKGLIFISIDDNELYSLKLLCDDIFAESNFIANIIWKRRSGGANDNQYIVPDHEYILVYAKNKTNTILHDLEYNPMNLKLYNCKDEFEKERGPYRRMLLNQTSLRFSESLTYSIECPDGTKIKPPKDGKSTWRWGQEKLKWGIKNGFIEFVKMKDSWRVYTKQYLYVDENGNTLERGSRPRTIYNEVDGREGIKELQRILGSKAFEYPKPVQLIKYLLKMSSYKDSIILDFFIGTGTTGQAMLDMNKEDNGKRRFIACTNNENNICSEVCYPRLKKVIEGYKNIEGGKREGLGGNLKYFKTDFVDAKPTDRNKKKLVDKSTEMLCLKEDCFDEVEKGSDFKIFKNSQNKYLGIIYDDDGIELFKKEAKKMKKKFIVYVFSLDESAREEEFEDMADMVQLKPIPAVILNVYKRIFK